jgi:outer membrane protein TolC
MHAAAVALLLAPLTLAAARQDQGRTDAASGPRALTLADAVSEALRASPELQPRVDRIRVAEVQERLASSAFATKLTPAMRAGSDQATGLSRALDVTLSRRLPTGADTFARVSTYTFTTPSSSVHDTGYSIGFSQPLLRGFHETATAPVTDARRAVTSASRDLDAGRAALVVRVSAAYFAVVKEDRLAAIARQAAARASTLKTSSRARAQAGLATELDVLRAELLEAQFSASVSTQEQAADAARETLALLIGRPAGSPIVLADATALNANAASPQGGLDDMIAHALASRPELDEARDRVHDAERRARVARCDLLPPLSLDMSYTRRGIGVPGADVLNTMMGGWRVAVNSAYGLDRAAERAAAETSQISVAAAERAVRDAEQRVASEVRQLFRAWEGAGARIALQTQAVDLAARQLRLAELRFERGLATSLEVVDAQASVMQTENALAAAELDRQVVGLDLQRAAGTLRAGADQ